MKRLAENGLTHREIAALLGMSHANVQVIERRAIAKLRKAAEKAGLKASDFLPLREPRT